LALQSVEKFQRLRVRHSKIIFCGDHQSWRFVFSQISRERRCRPLLVAFRIAPRGSQHIVLGKPQFFGSVHGGLVVNASVTDDRFEAPGVRGDPVGHKSPVRTACGGHPRTIDKFIIRQRVIHALDHVGIRLAAPVIGDFIGEFLTVTG
jgi:hypothetical protein